MKMTQLDGARAVKNQYWLAQTATASLLVAALGGCGAAAEGNELGFASETDSPGEGNLETAAQAITGGVLTGNSFGSVVKLVQSGTTCTASKLMGTNKFLTAAHCILNSLATSLTIFPNGDGSTGQISLSIPSGGIQIHPSFTLRNGSNSLDVYDAAVITTTTATPNIVGLQIPTTHQPPTLPMTASAIGYGCDATNPTPSHTGQRQFGTFDLTGGGLDHCITSSGPDVVCAGDSGGPLISSADGKLIGVFDAGPIGGLSVWTRTANIIDWINNPKPGNDPSLFQNSNFLFFMHNKKLSDGLPKGLCMVANSNVLNPPNPVSVLIDKCSDPIGHITGKGSGWTTISSSPAGRFVILSRATGQCLTPTGSTSGSDLQAVTCNSQSPSAAQKWFFATGAGSPPTLQIKNHSSNLCISTEGAGTVAGTKVEQATCDAGGTSSAQNWLATR